MYMYFSVIGIFTYVVFRCDHEKWFGITFLTDTCYWLLHIKDTFVTKIDKEISVLLVFIKIVYRCSLFITTAL